MAKLTPAEKQRRYREKRKLDEEREEAYKAKHQARNVKRKKVSELPDRQQRYQRKQWRKSDKIRRQKKKDLAAQDRASTPPPTPPLLNEKDVNDIALLLPKTVPAVKGTLMIHQIHTCQKGKISYREVSCFCKNNIWDTGKLCNCQFAQKYFSFLTDMPTSSTSKNCHGQKHVSKKKKCVYQNIYSSSNSSDSESFTSDCHVEFQESDEETFQTMTDRIEQEEMQDEEEVRAAQVGAWVLVQFTSKKSSTKHFVGQIIELNHENDDYVVKFVRKSGNFFQWPEMEDLSVVTRDDIVVVLPEPMPARRGDKVSFKLKFDGYNIN